MEAKVQYFLSEEAWEEFNAALEREYDPEDFPKMRKLLTMEAHFAKEPECTQ